MDRSDTSRCIRHKERGHFPSSDRISYLVGYVVDGESMITLNIQSSSRSDRKLASIEISSLLLVTLDISVY
jgi:hypothetical protein